MNVFADDCVGVTSNALMIVCFFVIEKGAMVDLIFRKSGAAMAQTGADPESFRAISRSWPESAPVAQVWGVLAPGRGEFQTR